MQTDFIADCLNNDTYKEYQKMKQEKERFLKQGNDVVHLEYLGNSFDESDFADFESKLAEVGLRLSRFDSSWLVKNNIDDYQLVTYFIISQPVLVELLKGISSNATWDAVKYILITGWKKLKDKTFKTFTSTHVEEKKMSFGMNVVLDKNTSFNFELNGNFSETTILKSIDKTLKFIEKQKANEAYKMPDYVYYDSEKEEWIKLDVWEEIKKKANKGL